MAQQETVETVEIGGEAELQGAILALDLAMEAGFEPYLTPDLARQKIVDSMAFSPRGEETQIYSIANTDLDLVGTAEITLGGLYADTILEEADRPTGSTTSRPGCPAAAGAVPTAR